MTVIMFTIWTVESEDVSWSAALNNEQNKTKNNPAALWLSPQIVPSEKKNKDSKKPLGDLGTFPSMHLPNQPTVVRRARW